MKMLKKGLVLSAALVTLWNVGSVCQAEIIPAYGPGQIGLTSVVLCESLTLRKENSSASEAVKTLHYGDNIIVMERKDGWAYCSLGDSEDSPLGWVNPEYVAIDPAWYRTDEKTTVYAWNDTAASKVAQLDKGTTLPILKDDGEWLVVSLRGASGWIHKTDADRAAASTQSKTSSEQTQKTTEQSKQSSEAADWFTVYAEDGSSVSIRLAEGAMYEDAKGRTYSNTRGDLYYCITTDVTYSADPSVWTDGEPTADDERTGADYGEGAGNEDNWGTQGDGEGEGDYDYWGTQGDGEGEGDYDYWGTQGDGEGEGDYDYWGTQGD